MEEKQKAKIGPRSIQKPWAERKSEILSGFNIPNKDPGISIPEELLGRHSLRPASTDRVLNAVKRTVNAGLPTLKQKGTILDEGLALYEKPFTWPCVMFTRTQEEGKTRTVWGYPFSTLIVEGYYFLPYFNVMREQSYFSAYEGPDYVDHAISNLLYQKEPNEVILSEDFSGFDLSVPEDLIYMAFDVIRSHYQRNRKDVIDAINDEFKTIGLVTPEGVWSGIHGIPSGSWFTSIVGSLVHLIAQDRVRPIQSNRNQVMGDDGVIVLPENYTKSDIAEVYSEVNLTLNEDKTFESNDEVIYLQKLWSPDYKFNGVYRGIYPIYRALNRLLHMERWTEMLGMSGNDYFAIRAIAILENCKWHPLFRPFVKWVVKHDKFDLEFSQQGLRDYVRNFQPKTSTTIKNQYSDDVSGLASFDTVRVINEL
jgi:hypothetical protein